MRRSKGLSQFTGRSWFITSYVLVVNMIVNFVRFEEKNRVADPKTDWGWAKKGDGVGWAAKFNPLLLTSYGKVMVVFANTADMWHCSRKSPVWTGKSRYQRD